MHLPAQRSLQPALVVGAAVVVAGAGLEHFAGLVVLVAFSALIAILARRLQLSLLGRGAPPWLALTVTVVAIVAMLAVLFGAAVASVAVVVTRLADDAALRADRLRADLARDHRRVVHRERAQEDRAARVD